MKRVILGLFIVLLLSGCSASINFDFKQTKIESTIEGSFNVDEYYKSANGEEDGDSISNTQKENLLLEDKNDISFKAFNSGNEVYTEIKFDKKEYDYDVLYKYDYDYSNIKSNYFFNCFDNYEFSEDDEYYNIKLTGSYKCTKGIKLRVKSDSTIEKSNSYEIEDSVHSFDIYDDDNNIFFSIRKDFEYNNRKSSLRVFVFVIMIIMSLITGCAYYIARRR